VFMFVGLSGLSGHAFSAFPCGCELLMDNFQQRALYRIIVCAV
jgi:hypothetical protein